MKPGIAEAWPLVLAVLAVSALVLLVRRIRQARRRQVAAVRETGLQLAFDACAPEGGMLPVDDFPAGRLRSGTIHASDTRRF